MTTFEQVQAANPKLNLHAISDPAFASFGRVLPHLPHQAALLQAMAETVIPETGNQYVATDAMMTAIDADHAISRLLYGEQPIQIGHCNGHSDHQNAFEWHGCSEVNLACTDLVLWLVHRFDIVDGQLASDQAQAFFVPAQTAIEVYATTLHFAPNQVTPAGFKCVVILTANTNSPLKTPRTPGESLLQTNKWVLAHPDNARMQAQQAAIGVTGPNFGVLPVLAD